MSILDYVNELDFSQEHNYTYENKLSDLDVDNLIEVWKECQQEIERLKQLEQEKIEQIKFNSEQARKPLENKMKFIEEQLKIAVMNNPRKSETKTMWKLKSISGEVQIKKSKQSIKNPNLKGEEARKNELFRDYVEEHVEYKFKWSSLKSQLRIVDGKIFNVETGEIYDMLEIEEEPEKVVIK